MGGSGTHADGSFQEARCAVHMGMRELARGPPYIQARWTELKGHPPPAVLGFQKEPQTQKVPASLCPIHSTEAVGTGDCFPLEHCLATPITTPPASRGHRDKSTTEHLQGNHGGNHVAGSGDTQWPGVCRWLTWAHRPRHTPGSEQNGV